MAKKRAKYTLWNIPRSAWSEPLEGIELSDDDRKEMVSFARGLDDNRLKERLHPFDTPVTQDTLSKSVGHK